MGKSVQALLVRAARKKKMKQESWEYQTRLYIMAKTREATDHLLLYNFQATRQQSSRHDTLIKCMAVVLLRLNGV